MYVSTLVSYTRAEAIPEQISLNGFCENFESVFVADNMSSGTSLLVFAKYLLLFNSHYEENYEAKLSSTSHETYMCISELIKFICSIELPLCPASNAEFRILRFLFWTIILQCFSSHCTLTA